MSEISWRQNQKIGEGDLDTCLEKTRDDDFGRTFDEFNRLVSNLRSVIENILEDMLTTLEEASQSEEAVRYGSFRHKSFSGNF